MPAIGKISALAKDIEKESKEKIEELRVKSMAKLEEREESEGDRWYEKQKIVPPPMLRRRDPG